LLVAMGEDDISYGLGGNGFALDEYLALPHGLAATVKGGTMGKAVNPPGGILDRLARAAKQQAPGPGYYFKDAVDKSFAGGAKGGTWGKLARDFRRKIDRSPAVGSYEQHSLQVTPRTKGGLMTKHDRVNIFAKIAERTNAWNSNGPGKYDAVRSEKNVATPSFQSPRTESRTGRKKQSVGPGHYTPNHTHTEKRPPEFSACKEETGGYMKRMNKEREATPFPWYKDMPDSKNHDKQGRNKHSQILLNDRQVTPRRPRASSAKTAQVTQEMDTSLFSAI